MKEQEQLINTAASNSVRLQQLTHFATQQIPPAIRTIDRNIASFTTDRASTK